MSLKVNQLKATQMLVLATALWGLSFPATKALALTQQILLPDRNSWFFAALCIVYRFGISALLMLPFAARTLGKITRLEISQGLGLGLFGGGGILLQVDGLAHTSASTSAFLTQCYCLFIPLWVALRKWQRPPAKMALSCVLVAAGVAMLAKVDWQNLRLGRGEWETLLSSVLFTGQIFLLEQPKYADNRVAHFSLVMFAVMALVSAPVAVLTTQQPGDWYQAYHSPAALGFLGLLIILCTFGSYLLMNHWQRHVTATHAGLIYSSEPLFASAFALCLPAWFSTWAAIEYANEKLAANLLLGGAFITVANILIQIPSRSRPPGEPQDIARVGEAALSQSRDRKPSG